MNCIFMSLRTSTSRLSLVFLLLLLVPSVIRAEQGHQDHPIPEKLGAVTFPTTCNPAVQSQFARAVALLHSFAYSAAESSFREVAGKDPNCAIAHWGIAMTNFHELWDPPLQPGALERGRNEIHQAQRIAPGSDREQRFIRALAVFYEQDSGSVPYQERVSKYANAMGELAAAYPEDAESQVFYALALLAKASPFDKTHTNQKAAVKLLDPLFRQHPQHPGIAHYLIHAYDNQEMAPQGLRAAREYSKIAPSAPHALHMPSHIFTRLGMWNESIASNRAARISAHHAGDLGEELHAMDYLVYAFLQNGRESDAEEVLRQLKTMTSLDERDFKIAYASTAMPIRYALERRQWAEAAVVVPPEGAPPHVTALAVWARGIGLARSGQPAGARPEVEKLRRLEGQLRQSHGEYGEYWAKQVEVQALEVLAWSAQAESKTNEAQGLLRKAADDEDAIEKLPVTPGPVVPAREQLGDLLLEQNQPKAALKEFQAALLISPRRRAAITGVSRASEALAITSSHN